MVKYRPAIVVGRVDRIDAGVENIPVHQTILPEAQSERRRSDAIEADATWWLVTGQDVSIEIANDYSTCMVR